MIEPSIQTITVSRHGRVALIAMNRPAAMNAISMQMRADLRQALDTLRKDVAISAAVLTGSGDKAFSAGMDLREFVQSTPTCRWPR